MLNPSGASRAQSARQNPSLMHTSERLVTVYSRARDAGHKLCRIKYIITSVADRLTPAPQCTSTPARAVRVRTSSKENRQKQD
eukprot:359453-Chlamydomonas_euryale.AAC.7